MTSYLILCLCNNQLLFIQGLLCRSLLPYCYSTLTFSSALNKRKKISQTPSQKYYDNSDGHMSDKNTLSEKEEQAQGVKWLLKNIMMNCYKNHGSY